MKARALGAVVTVDMDHLKQCSKRKDAISLILQEEGTDENTTEGKLY